ncbi:hypothetical protein CCAX7_60710 [Capsulimonas corticalis]|uniref:Uncharacterized protein n=1 Tax=Capsulimonas corticalis TaxID=2219043 RepID=A0A402CW30_9BACT|nr:DUF4864 domain-containing protein [Capsulimonas corticalis]BDI34020.1 hypothetical protein CCAX7_60710 [Capsulimonas corticalis]
MKPRAIAAAAFVAVMLICGGYVLRQWQVKHPPRLPGMQDRDFRDGRDGRDWRGGAGNWREARPEERKAAMACVDGQLDAFRKDDYPKAISYQSEILRPQFRSATQFRNMIIHFYPEFSNARKVDYGRAFTDGSGRLLAIRVDLTGANGRHVSARYRLIKEKNTYRVMGVDDGH